MILNACKCCGNINQWSKSPIRLVDDHLELITFNRKEEIESYAKFDIEDYEKVRKYRWVKGNIYIIGSASHFRGRRNVRLHEYLMPKVKKGLCIDHINGDPLDNRKKNLRVVPVYMNVFNSIRQRGKSGYIGIVLDKTRKKYFTYITSKGKQINLGRYADIKDAIEARKKGELKYYGELSPQYRNMV